MSVGARATVAAGAAVVTGTVGGAEGARVAETGAGVAVAATVPDVSMAPSLVQAARVIKASTGMIKAAKGPLNPILVIIS